MTLKQINEKYDFMKDVCFEHDEGWANIIDEFCSCLQYIFDKEKTNYGFNILQIKEKFGILTIYFCYNENVPEKIQKITKALVDEAREKSKITCEKCGQYGDFRSSTGWVHTYCDVCEENYIKEIKSRI